MKKLQDSATDSTQHTLDSLTVGDQVRLTPDSRTTWWRVAARNKDHLVLVKQAAFEESGIVEYCVTGSLNCTYNGQGPGPVRSSLNSLGGGWDMGKDGIDAETAITALESGDRQLSMRRLLGIQSVEVRNGN